MAFIPVPGVAQIQVFGRIDGQQTINDLYFASGAVPITDTDLLALASAIDVWAGTAWVTLLSSAFTYQRVHARSLEGPAAPIADVTDSAAAGGAGGAFVPNNVAPCISFRSSAAGRSGRGRNYIPGVAQSVVDGNNLTGGFAADMVASYQSLLPGGAFAPDGWAWVIVSRFTAGAPRAEGIAQGVLRVLFTDLVVDSQRRRLPGRGA
jgi:hypothetical protein